MKNESLYSKPADTSTERNIVAKNGKTSYLTDETRIDDDYDRKFPVDIRLALLPNVETLRPHISTANSALCEIEDVAKDRRQLEVPAESRPLILLPNLTSVTAVDALCIPGSVRNSMSEKIDDLATPVCETVVGPGGLDELFLLRFGTATGEKERPAVDGFDDAISVKPDLGVYEESKDIHTKSLLCDLEKAGNDRIMNFGTIGIEYRQEVEHADEIGNDIGVPVLVAMPSNSATGGLGGATAVGMETTVGEDFSHAMGQTETSVFSATTMCDQAIRAAPYTQASQFISLVSSFADGERDEDSSEGTDNDVQMGGGGVGSSGRRRKNSTLRRATTNHGATERTDGETGGGRGLGVTDSVAGAGAGASSVGTSSGALPRPVSMNSLTSSPFTDKRHSGAMVLLKHIQDVGEKLQERINARDFGGSRKREAFQDSTAHARDTISSFSDAASAHSDPSGLPGRSDGAGSSGRSVGAATEHRPVRSILDEFPRMSLRRLLPNSSSHRRRLLPDVPPPAISSPTTSSVSSTSTTPSKRDPSKGISRLADENCNAWNVIRKSSSSLEVSADISLHASMFSDDPMARCLNASANQNCSNGSPVSESVGARDFELFESKETGLSVQKRTMPSDVTCVALQTMSSNDDDCCIVQGCGSVSVLARHKDSLPDSKKNELRLKPGPCPSPRRKSNPVPGTDPDARGDAMLDGPVKIPPDASSPSSVSNNSFKVTAISDRSRKPFRAEVVVLSDRSVGDGESTCPVLGDEELVSLPLPHGAEISSRDAYRIGQNDESCCNVVSDEKSAVSTSAVSNCALSSNAVSSCAKDYHNLYNDEIIANSKVNKISYDKPRPAKCPPEQSNHENVTILVKPDDSSVLSRYDASQTQDRVSKVGYISDCSKRVNNTTTQSSDGNLRGIRDDESNSIEKFQQSVDVTDIWSTAMPEDRKSGKASEVIKDTGAVKLTSKVSSDRVIRTTDLIALAVEKMPSTVGRESPVSSDQSGSHSPGLNDGRSSRPIGLSPRPPFGLASNKAVSSSRAR